MAVAYLFHIIKNHPLVDGNERTGLIAALVFMALNDCNIEAPKDDLFNMTYAVAEGSLSKSEAADFFRRWAKSE